MSGNYTSQTMSDWKPSRRTNWRAGLLAAWWWFIGVSSVLIVGFVLLVATGNSPIDGL